MRLWRKTGRQWARRATDELRDADGTMKDEITTEELEFITLAASLSAMYYAAAQDAATFGDLPELDDPKD